MTETNKSLSKIEFVNTGEPAHKGSDDVFFFTHEGMWRFDGKELTLEIPYDQE